MELLLGLVIPWFTCCFGRKAVASDSEFSCSRFQTPWLESGCDKFHHSLKRLPFARLPRERPGYHRRPGQNNASRWWCCFFGGSRNNRYIKAVKRWQPLSFENATRVLMFTFGNLLEGIHLTPHGNQKVKQCSEVTMMFNGFSPFSCMCSFKKHL